MLAPEDLAEEGKTMIRSVRCSILVTLFLAALTVKSFGQGGDWGAGHEMGGWGYGGLGWLGIILMVLFWLAVIVGIIFLIRWLAVSAAVKGSGATSGDSPLDILKKRYARGEINKEEFEQKKKDLGY
jgi:putative membrane protein